MKFLLDHDVPFDLARVLRRAGHDATCLQDSLPVTTTDADVFSHARREHCVLVTCNRDDFVPLAGDMGHHGLIVLIRRRSRIAECAAFMRLLDQAGETGIRGNVNFA